MELKKVTKHKIAFYFKKIILPIAILIIFVISSGYYFLRYYEDRELNFSTEEKLIFWSVVGVLILLIGVFIYNQIDKSILLKIIFRLEAQISEAEENCILVNRDTQEMICHYLKKEKKEEKDKKEGNLGKK